MTSKECLHGADKGICPYCCLGISLPSSVALTEAAKAAPKRIEERKRKYESATPEERAKMNEEAIQGAVRFIMDERVGGK